MDEKEIREYVLRAHKEGHNTAWIAAVLGIDQARVWRIVSDQPRNSGFKITWPEGFFDEEPMRHRDTSWIYTQKEWEQRLKDKKAEGAHPDVLRYHVEAQIAEATVSPPVPDAVWTGALEFHCPICNEAGSIASRVAPENPVIYAAPHGHADLGEGNFTCPFAGENRPWRVTYFIDRIGGAAAESDAVPGSLSWLQYHDRLVKEWFDGERELVDDLYPDPEKPSLQLRKKSLNVYHGLAAACIGLTVFVLITGNTVTGMIWMSCAALNLVLAKRP